MIPGSANPLLLKSAAAAAGGYQVSRSLRFNSSDSAFCSRTPAVAGSRTTWTFSTWIKRSKLGVLQRFFTGATATNDNDWMAILFNASDQLVIGGYNTFFRTSNSVYRDCSAWYHLVVLADLGNGTNSLKLRAWINNEEVAWSSTSSNPTTTGINAANNHAIGAEQSPNNGGVGSYFDGYLADIHFIDGQALTPSSFTEVSATTGQLEPKAYTGSYGTNGFQLKFADNSSNTASTLGKDTSGNSNNWTPNNFSVTAGANYLPYLTSSNNSLTDGLNAFDASVSTLAYGGGGQLDFAPSPAISYSSSVEIYLADADGRNQYNFNSGGWVSPSPNSGWITVASGSGTLTTLSARDSISSGQISVAAYRIDGSILVDQRAAGKENDSLVDSPTNYGTDTGVGGEVRGNYCTWNPLDTSGGTLTNGNLDLATGTATYGGTRGTVSVSSGKWYWEVTPTAMTTSGELVGIGICASTVTLPSYAGAGTLNYTYMNDGQKRVPGSDTNYGATYTVNDVIGVALDLDAGTLVFYKNGASQGTAFSSLSGSFAPYASDADAAQSCTVVANFGQRAFAYQTPGTNRPAATFKALCTQNLPAPLIAKPNQHFDIITYPGNGSTQTLPNATSTPATALDFGGVGQIGFSWIKQRSDPSTSHALYDARRGVQARLESDTPDQEATSDNGVTAFNAGTFALGSQAQANSSSETYVAWCWATDDQDSTSHTQGSITSTVRANASAGFSVVTWTGNGTSGATVGHGLGVAPQLLIVKRRSSAGTTANWAVWHGNLTAGYNVWLNGTDNAQAYSPSRFTSTLPTSTVFSLGGGDETNGSGSTYVAYCFSPVSGYSSFGSYTGNGSTNGPFVYTGFRPRWVLIKKSSGTENWRLHDTARSSYNVMQSLLFPNLSQAETTNAEYNLDVLSNGFKIRTNVAGSMNDSGATYIYAAFAESPFQFSRAR